MAGVFLLPQGLYLCLSYRVKRLCDLNGEFQKRDAQILAGSTDSEFVHHAWRTHEKDLNNLPFPMLADVKRELSVSLGILDLKEGVAQRAVFIVDPEGIIRFVYVTDLSVGRSPKRGFKGVGCFKNWRALSV